MDTEHPETATAEPDFAAFEAKATEPAKVEETTEKKAEPVKTAEELELGSEEAPVATAEEIEEEKKRTRSQRWEKRVDNLTARLRDAERRAAEAESKGGKTEETTEAAAPDPTDEKYEFGQADPAYIADLARHQVRAELADERKKTREADEKDAGQAEFVQRIGDGMTAVEKAGVEKYDDFEDVIAAAAEAREGEPLHPLLGIGIATSPVGADIAYRLASDETVADRIEKMAKVNPHAAAIAFGELEGEFLGDDDSDLNPADALDLARMLGREKARRKGLSKPTTERKVITNAPEPSEHRARGGNGQFEVAGDTMDFAAFEKKANGAKR